MARDIQSSRRNGAGGGGSASAGERGDTAGDSPLAGAKRPAVAAALGSPDGRRRSAGGSSNVPLRRSTADAIASRVQASIKTAHAALRGAAADVEELATLLPGNDAAVLKAAREHQAACHLMADDLSGVRSEVDIFIGSALRTLQTSSTGDSMAVHPAAAVANAVEHIVRPAAATAAAAGAATTSAATPATAANAAEVSRPMSAMATPPRPWSTGTTGTAGSTNHDSNSNVKAVLPDAGSDVAGNAARSSPAF